MSVTITTDVFCDTCSHWAHYGTSGSKAMIQRAHRAARHAGWTIKRDGTCICPECNGSQPKYGYWGALGGTPSLADPPRSKA